MATLILTAVGTAVGGPIGGAIGALVGRQIDSAVLGTGGGREGPRLKDLSVTTSSYGHPIARHFGTMRVPGTIIWATDLKESKETSGGGKGKPKTTTYSYSASFAVALSSRPITDVGRIWADGNLLRGSSGDLKAGGELRIFHGRGDELPDPLMEGAEGAACPAFRDCAYVVFEDLELGDFGNRLPALTFEVIADSAAQVDLARLVGSRNEDVGAPVYLPLIQGFSDEGGEIGGTLKAIDRLFPLDCKSGGDALECMLAAPDWTTTTQLPESVHAQDAAGEGSAAPFEKRRKSEASPQPRALRYYDPARDYQPGMQRAAGKPPPGREVTVEFAGSLSSNDAKIIVTDLARRTRAAGETIAWRMAELDPALQPGSSVRVPGQPGLWIIRSWEWLDLGIELALERASPATSGVQPGDAGSTVPPPDLSVSETTLMAIELPWDGTTPADAPSLFAATSSPGQGWRGAQLYFEQAGSLAPLGPSNNRRCVVGWLSTGLGPSSPNLVDRATVIDIELLADDLVLADTTIGGIASGANRLLVGNEIVQFLSATAIGNGHWALQGLLRGRGGTEHLALSAHPAGTAVLLLDDALTILDPATVPSAASSRLAAIGIGDEQPVYATLTNSGSTRRPLTPVHPRASYSGAGDLALSWTRRARGQWRWEDYIETPVIEEIERYVVGFGPVQSPHTTWEVAETCLTLDAAILQSLITSHGNGEIHVRQLGTYGQSEALHLTTLS